MNIRFTNFYTPNSRDSLRFFKIEKQNAYLEKDLEDEIPGFEKLVNPSFWIADSGLKNGEYKQLLDLFRAKEFKMSEILSQLDVKVHH